MKPDLENLQLTIIIPVYNEAEIIEEVVRGFYEKVIRKIPHSRLIVAEDGSVDGTKEKLQELNREIPFTLISGRERKGYTKAFKDAMAMAETDLVFFSDSDGQHDPGDIFRMLEEIDCFDIVGGYKSPRRDPVHRIIISKGYNYLVSLIFGLRMKDIDSGFKLIRKKVIDEVLGEVCLFKFGVMSEFILRAYMAGYKIHEIPVTHNSRRHGGSSIFTPSRLPSIVFGQFKGLLALKQSYKGKKST